MREGAGFAGRLSAAYTLCRDVRAVLERVGREQGRVTRRTRCPIDVASLMAFISSPGAADRPRDDYGRVKRREKTFGEQATEFLRQVIKEGDGRNVGYVDIEYGYAPNGEALQEAGHMFASREYARGADPFKLPKQLRNLALARFGYDFDDTASYPRALALRGETWRRAWSAPRPCRTGASSSTASSCSLP